MGLLGDMGSRSPQVRPSPQVGVNATYNLLPDPYDRPPPPLPAPQVLREMRVKGALMDHKEIRAAMGVRVVAPGLEHAVAGTSLFVIRPDDDEEELRATVRRGGKGGGMIRWVAPHLSDLPPPLTPHTQKC